MNPVQLPKVKSEIDNRWISQKTVMIGAPGCGKSTFWSFGDKTLYIQTEAGLNHLSVMKLIVGSWEEWEGVYGALVLAKSKGEMPYDTIVIDTIDRICDFAGDEAVARGRDKYKSAEINVVGDIPNGAGWSWQTNLIENTLSKLEGLGCHIVLIGHLDRREIKQPNNVSIHLQTISIGGKTGRAITSWCDHLLNIEAKMVGSSMQRVVRTVPTSTVDAKSRGAVVKDGWVWEADDKSNYAKFRSAFK